MRAARSFALALLALALGACGTTNREAIESLRGDYAAERARLATFVARLPAPGVASAPAIAAFSPSLRWSDVYGTSETSNAAFFSPGQLVNPDLPRVEQGPDVALDSQLLTCLAWTGPANPMAESALGTREGDHLTSECRAALALPYIVVLRPLTFHAPSALGSESYAPGLLVEEIFVLSHATGDVVAMARIEARSDDVVRYVYEPGSDPAEALSRFAYSTLWTNVRRAVAAAFAAGGHVVTPNG